jgi:RsiW-degrading membrane proteinase PrsW (M82 family)
MMSRPAALLATALACTLFALLAWRLAATPAVLLLGAIVPALGYAGLTVRIDRFGRQPVALLSIAFLWGAAAAAPLADAANDAAQAWLAAVHETDRAASLTAFLAAPAIEESAKAALLPLLLVARRATLDGVLDGIVYGALIGIGFAMTENATYFLLAAVQGGEIGLWQNVYLRALLGGLNHAVFTASVGAALGWAVQRRGHWRWWAAPLGLVLAVGEHTVWNALAAGTIHPLVCNPASPDGPCRTPAPAVTLFVTVPLVVAAVIGPALAVLALLARSALRREAAIVAGQLRAEVGANALSAQQYGELCSCTGRGAAERRAWRRAGLRGWRKQRRFHLLATELAVLRQRRGPGTTASAAERACRAEMLALARQDSIPS